MIGQNYLPALLAWNTVFIVLCIILGVVLAALIVLTIVGRKMQKKQAENEVAMQQASQILSMLIIDKKRMKLKEAGLPQIVLEQTPKYMRGTKVPIVKAKVGPKIMSLMCDQKIFELLPVKKEVKAVVSGIYIMDIKGSRNNLEAPVAKKGRLARLRQKAENTIKAENDKKSSSKKPDKSCKKK